MKENKKTNKQRKTEVEKLRQRISELKKANLELKREEEELQHAYDELRDREKLYRTLIDHIDLGISLIDTDHNIVIVSAAEGKHFNRPITDFIGKKCYREIEKREAVCPHCPGVRAMATGQPAAVETEGIGTDGSRYNVRLQAFPVFGDDGLVTGFIEIYENITERKQSEEALRESEEELEAIFNNVRIGIALFDKTGKILKVNKRLLEVGGYTEKEIIGKRLSLLKMFPPKSMAKMLTNFAKLIAGKKVPPFDVEVYTKKGEKRTTELHGSFLRKNGKVVGMLGVMRDVTERKQAEERLKESFEELKKSLESTVSALASALEMRDPYTAGHQQRVADLACAIAEEMGLADEQINGIRMAGFIHDIGKINIPAEILNKPGQLTEIEYNLFKNHPQVGHDVLKTVEFPWPVAQIVLQHHERMDGSGYPQGLSGEEIMLEARILAVADIVEAIASHRPYRPARGTGDALEEILRNKGVLYDPQVVDACLRVFYEKGFRFENVLQVLMSSKIH